MNRFATISGILSQILNHTAKVNPSLRDILQKGLSKTQLKEKIRTFPFCLPQEVEELYQWRDGMPADVDNFLFHDHYFPSLDKAIAEYQMNLSWRVIGDDDPTIVPNLLPLFSFQSAFYGVYCGSKEQDEAPIYFVHHGEELVYENLTTMLSAILECYETGAYRPVMQDGSVSTIVDEQRVAEIKLRWNPVRNEAYQNALRQNRFYHYP
jgi:hypothetical protein